MAALIAVLIFFISVSNGCSQDADTVHPEFTLKQNDLEQTVSALPVEVRDRILAQPKAFLGLMGKALDEPQELLQIVDKKTALPPDSVPPDLSALDHYTLTLTKSGLSLRLVLIADLLDMTETARMQGAPLPLSSTYRSYAQQVALYQNALKTQSKAEVEKELAPPGHSQHQLGTAIDFGSIDLSFADTAAGQWLFTHAWTYGFSLSYPKGKEKESGYSYEPWHYRYVGKPAAGLIHDFFGGSQQAFLEFYAGKSGIFRQARTRK
jgi:D-alanyl-D-alanine carboxypeptidase